MICTYHVNMHTHTHPALRPTVISDALRCRTCATAGAVKLVWRMTVRRPGTCTRYTQEHTYDCLQDSCFVMRGVLQGPRSKPVSLQKPDKLRKAQRGVDALPAHDDQGSNGYTDMDAGERRTRPFVSCGVCRADEPPTLSGVLCLTF
jgi:hypothetical protein